MGWRIVDDGRGFVFIGPIRSPSWGDQGRSSPGNCWDELVPNAMLETTHGVTINAPASAIWPWLLQVGYHRGGWYTDSKISEFLFKYLFEPMAPQDKKPNYWPCANRIMPEFQELQFGEIVHDGPPDTVGFVVKALEPNQAMVLHTDQYHRAIMLDPVTTSWFQKTSAFCWVFALNEIQPGGTRLLSRGSDQSLASDGLSFVMASPHAWRNPVPPSHAKRNKTASRASGRRLRSG